jgi:hypothetical protein
LRRAVGIHAAIEINFVQANSLFGLDFEWGELLSVFRHFVRSCVLLEHLADRSHAGQSFVVVFFVFFIVDVVFGRVLTFLFVSEILILLSGISDDGGYLEPFFGFGNGIGRHGLPFTAFFELVSGTVIVVEPTFVPSKRFGIFKNDFLFFFLILDQLFPLRVG